MPPHPPTPRDPVSRVSTVELFFDLVFVFTITQLTTVLAADFTWPTVGEIFLMLGMIWWMYAGYAWLTNAVAPNNTNRRFQLLVGMCGFLTIALSLPHAMASHDGTGWAFGVGYFVVNLIHSSLFVAVGGAKNAMKVLGPTNFTTATMILIGGFTPMPLRLWLWLAAAALQLISPYIRPIGGFLVGPAHFVERHGLVIIVALGESLVAIGLGLSVHLESGLLIVAVLSLTLCYFLYWAYFGGDEVRAEHALEAITDANLRARTALRAFGYAHWPMLLGIVAVAAGLKKLVLHPFEPLTLAQATALSGGAALFLASDIYFRATLGIDRNGLRLTAAAGAAATIPLGPVRGLLQLSVLVTVLVIFLSVDGYLRLIANQRGTVANSPT
jgi:low temperature requirement protein LtrA